MSKQDLRKRLPGRLLRFAFLTIVCFLAAGAARSAILVTQPPLKNVEDSILIFKQEIEGLRKALNIPGLSVAVLQGQKAVFADGFGYADIENKIPATANTPYNIASLTKPFAAAVLMKLVETGRLNLDDEMAEILKHTVFPWGEGTIHGASKMCKKIKELSKDPSFIFARLLQDYRCDTERITVRHHLTHTAQGVPGEAYR